MSRKGCPNKTNKKVKFICATCNNEWLDYPSRVGIKKYCSKKCYSVNLKKTCKERSKGNNWGSLRKLNSEYRKKMSLIMKGKRRPNIGKSKKGKLNPNWKGGTSPKNKLIRRSAKFFQWRKAVFDRDNYTCQICKIKGGELHPDHIKQFAYYPNLRFELSNGRTLCKGCHMKTDTWGFKKHKLPEKQV